MIGVFRSHNVFLVPACGDGAVGAGVLLMPMQMADDDADADACGGDDGDGWWGW